MAYAQPRSANGALNEGATDGKYRKVVMDRGGFVEVATWESRRCLTDAWYGIHEDPDKVRPDTVFPVHTPQCVSTPPARPEYF